MKRMDLFCASPASTAICSSMDQRSMVRHGTRPFSHHSHSHSHSHLGGGGGDRRKGLTLPVPCTSQLPIDPKPYYPRKSSAKQADLPRKSSAGDINELISPPGSSRYLLSDTPFFDMVSDSDHVKASVLPRHSTKPRHLSDMISDSDHVKALVLPRQSTKPRHLSDMVSDSDHVKALVLPRQSTTPRHLSANDSVSLKSSSTHSRSRSRDQVVELRVSIHCKGCEGKVRKHISRMEGVTSFSIDLATKKVTIIGDVTPLGVLTSISRVKNAQFWPLPTSPSPPSSSSSPMVKLSH